MASQVYSPSKTWFRFQKYRWLIVCLILFQWFCSVLDVSWYHQYHNSTNAIFLSYLRNDVTANLTNPCRLKPETKPDTVNVRENTMCSLKKVRSLGFQSDEGNIATDVLYVECENAEQNLPSIKGNFFKTPKHIHNRKTLIKMYTDYCFKCKNTNKRLYNINETTDAGFVDIVKPLIGFFDKAVSKISLAGRRVLFEMLIFVSCVCVMILNDRYTRKGCRIFDQDVANLNTSTSDKYSIDKQTRFRFLNIFYNIPRVSVHIYPFSINQYANDVVKKQKSAEELMKYEWSRYLSFKNFPLDCPMMPMRLAQAGLYYTGHDQEVRCFSCGMINREWSPDETAVEIHKRLSPGCQFIRGENTDNVEIHAKEYYNGLFDVASHNGDSGWRPARFESRTSSRTGDSTLSPSLSTPGANGGPFDALNHNPREENNIKTTSNQPTIHSNNTVSFSNKTASHPSHPSHPEQSDQTTTASKAAITANTVAGLSPKHPQYTELAARVGSFIGWTLLEIQDPMELAQAGFFYTGVKDFVRCYYCGVGLKNWERGDDPWTEHSRWSHGCGHVLSSRAAGGSMDDMAKGHEDSMPIPPAVNQQKNGALLGNGGLDKNAGASGSSDMDTAAARSLLDMGYTHEQVQTAVRKYRSENNSKPLTAVTLVDILETHHSLEDAATTSPQLQTTGNASTSEQLPSNPSSDDHQHSSNQPSIVQSSSYCSTSVDQSQTGQSHTSTENGSTSNNKDETREHSSISEGAKSLLEENRELKSRMQCKICLDRNANMIFLPCGHMVACQTCAVPLRKCAICRKLIKGSVRVYQS